MVLQSICDGQVQTLYWGLICCMEKFIVVPQLRFAERPGRLKKFEKIVIYDNKAYSVYIDRTKDGYVSAMMRHVTLAHPIPLES